jgi:hypothetical protein
MPMPAIRWAAVMVAISAGSFTARSGSMIGSDETSSIPGFTLRNMSTRKAGVSNHCCIATRRRVPDAGVAALVSASIARRRVTTSLIWPPTDPQIMISGPPTSVRSSSSSAVNATRAGAPVAGMIARGCARSIPKNQR